MCVRVHAHSLTAVLVLVVCTQANNGTVFGDRTGPSKVLEHEGVTD